MIYLMALFISFNFYKKYASSNKVFVSKENDISVKN